MLIFCLSETGGEGVPNWFLSHYRTKMNTCLENFLPDEIPLILFPPLPKKNVQKISWKILKITFFYHPQLFQLLDENFLTLHAHFFYPHFFYRISNWFSVFLVVEGSAVRNPTSATFTTRNSIFFFYLTVRGFP